MTVDPLTSDRPRPHDPLVSIVLPVFNEAEVLLRLRSAVELVLAECEVRYEIVFVDDGSTDGSAAGLDAFAREDTRLRVLHFARNFGHQAAVHAGLQHANGELVIVMDSDLQDDPHAIVEFLARWRAGYDVVYAVRRERKEGPVKRWLFRTFYRLLARVSEIPIPRDAGNFGLVDRRVVDAMLRLGDTDRFYPGLRSWVGFRQIGVPVERLARYDDTPRVSMLGLVRLAKTAIFSFSRFPLTAFYFVATVAGLVGLAGVAIALGSLIAGTPVPAGTGLVVAAAWVSLLNALGIAIVGEYVGRIHDSVRARPAYIVDRIVARGAATTSPPDSSETLLQSLDEIYNDITPPSPAETPDFAGNRELVLESASDPGRPTASRS